jgi:ribonuclease P protein subunit POP4
MAITPRNLVKHEIIGLEATVEESPNKSMVGLKGEVVDETRNTITVETKTGEKIIQKKNTVFMFKLPDGSKVKVDGTLLVAKPEERTKKRLKKW